MSSMKRLGSQSLRMAVNMHSSTLPVSMIENSRAETAMKYPLSFLTWNVNGLRVRMQTAWQWNGFVNLVNYNTPDIICLQEVKLPAHSPVGARRRDGAPRDPSKVKSNEKQNKEDCHLIDRCLNTDFPNYSVHWSLSEWRYAGQLMLIKKQFQPKVLRFNLNLELPANAHSQDGRTIAAFFDSLVVISTYTPNNGASEDHFIRRRVWDEEMLKFMQSLKKDNQKIIWLGDLNCAPEDVDLSHSRWFRMAIPILKNPRHSVEEFSIEDYSGQAGCTNAERKRFKHILDSCDLVDTYRELYPTQFSPDVNSSGYTWRGNLLVIFIRILSSSLMPMVWDCSILGYDSSQINFFGSDHCPVYLRFYDNYMENIK
ncbi:exonuclease III APE [Cardiosporidium cionae]|uniref:DNA-(apurinic or apyrimidinic site) endonuclease n=1 Tax=Cardiosporidium cionae TaxID=476202 RepID=A0ABQ7JC27_9APIC|nr:exonuclease III APE [Cardiosporidium cionae]|eukprot:KAF8821555.1 exonuclease III APE [Cardiosporidium cionae]